MNSSIIFDMDGVIIDSEPIYVAVQDRLYAELGIVVRNEEQAGFVGTPDREVWDYLRRTRGLEVSTQELLAKARQRYHEHIDTHGPEPLVPGARSLIERLKSSGYPLGLASSSPVALIERVCAGHGLRTAFDVVVGGDQVPRHKPAPDIFLRAAELLGAEPRHCLVIEDSTHGVRAAKAAGMTCVGFRNWHAGPQDLSAADLLVDSLEGRTFETICEQIRERLPTPARRS